MMYKNKSDKTLALWGTGNVCGQLMESNRNLNPSVFIDNNKMTVSMAFGRQVLHPSEIDNWENFYIILALDNYMSVKKQLEALGLIELQDFIWYKDWLFPFKIEKLFHDADEFLNVIQANSEQFKEKTIIFSDFLAFDKGVCNFVNRWSKKESIVLLSEAGWIENEVAKQKMHIPVLKLPDILSHDQYLKKESTVRIKEEQVAYIKEKPILSEASINLRMGYPDMAEGYEYAICYSAERIICKILDCWKPVQIVLWNAFYALHFIIRKICEESGIPVKFAEFGNIPGTITVEGEGQMGESWPAKFPKDFLKIPISDEEYNHAGQLVNYLRKNKLNRNVQPQNNALEKIKKKLRNNRPVVFFAGQNDNAAGMQPYTENTRSFHSPIFKSSDEAAVFLENVCEQNNWNYIYKPHPMMVKSFKISSVSDNMVCVNDVDINELIDLSDVTVTILSSVSYIALIRQRPVVMLGYTQLKGKGCTYEAFEKQAIENQLKEAIDNHVPEKMTKAFIYHIAQMKKYYLSK